MATRFRDIEELLDQVCSALQPEISVDRHSLCALALSWRQLSRLALNALWRDLRFVEPLLNLLGCTYETGYALVSRAIEEI